MANKKPSLPPDLQPGAAERFAECINWQSQVGPRRGTKALQPRMGRQRIARRVNAWTPEVNKRFSPEWGDSNRLAAPPHSGLVPAEKGAGSRWELLPTALADPVRRAG